MPLQDRLKNLEAINENILKRYYFTGQDASALPLGKRFDFSHTRVLLEQLTPLEEVIDQHIDLGCESDLLMQQIGGADALFADYDPLIEEAKLPDESTGWLWFKKIIPGEFYIKKQDKAALKNHSDDLAHFIPSQSLVLLGRQVLRLKALAEKHGDITTIYTDFRELYLALHQEEAARQLTRNGDTYQATAHYRITRDFTKVACDIANHGGLPPRLKSLEGIKKQFHRLETRTVHPRVRTTVACVIGGIIGAALGFTLGLLAGGVGAIPGMFAGAALLSTLAGSAFMATALPAIGGPITYFHARHKVKRHEAHRAITGNAAVSEALTKIKALRA